MSDLKATICLDDTFPHVRPLHPIAEATATTQAVDKPFIFVEFVDAGLSLWGHDPQAFRRLEQALRQAAAQLEAAALGTQTETAEDRSRLLATEGDASPTPAPSDVAVR